MMKRLRRPVAFLLVFVLLFTFAPYASATGTAVDDTTDPQDSPATGADLMVLADSGIMTVADANCNSTLLATFWVNTPEVNPSGVEDYFLYYEFPAGEEKHRNNIGLHAVQVDGVWKAAYCIEPGIAEAPAYYKDEVTLEQMLSHSGKTSTLTEEQFQAIGVAMLYGQIAMPEDGMYDALCRMLATQIIVWEIALGWRQPYAPFTCTNDAFIRRYANGDKGVEVSSYFLTIPAGQRVTAIQSEYSDISAKLAKHYAVPSFTSPRESQAPTIQLQPDGNGKYTATVTDTNGILDDFTFANTDKLTFSRSGNTLTITANGSVSETLVAPTKNIPSLDKQAYYLWYSGSYQNMVACTSEPTNDPIPAFFKVTVPTGDLRVKKNAVNGSAEGWNFQILDANKNLLYTITTGADGYATSPMLLPGTYYIREVHDRNETYWTYDATVEKQVTVTAGTQAQVSYTNTQYGRVQIIKDLDTDGTLAGWQFKITDANGDEIEGSPITSQADGTILTGKLAPGQYTIEELIPEGSLFYCKTENPQTVTVTAGKTTSVKFANALRPGKISIQKVDTYGQPLAGAKFILEWSDDGTNWAPVTASKNADVVKGCSANKGTQVTPASGYIEWTNLYPGIYYRITELEAPEGYNLLTTAAFEGKLPIDDLSVNLRVVNIHIFTLPKTGSHAPVQLPLSVALCLAVCAGALFVLRKKEG